MLNFLKALFMPPPASGALAKERLRLVLLSDHLSLAPDVVDALKRDLLEVISRYVEIDAANADVTFEHREREVAMLASIPITGVRDRPVPEVRGETAPSADEASSPASEASPAGNGELSAAAGNGEPPVRATGDAELPQEVQTAPGAGPPHTAREAALPTVDRTGQGASQRRRRRKKARAAAVQAAGRASQPPPVAQSFGEPAQA